MATMDEILAVLEVCGRAFPNQSISKATAEVYLRSLADIPGGLLRQAAECHIAESVYFPRIAQLRGMAARLAGTSRFDCLPAEQNPDRGVFLKTPRSKTQGDGAARFDYAPLRSARPDYAPLPRRSTQGGGAARDELAYQAQALEEAFNIERRLDPAAWLALAEAFEQADRPHRGAYTRCKLAELQAVQEREGAAIPIPA